MDDANASLAAASAGDPVFTAVLKPYRSLSPRGFAVLMGAILACTTVIGLAFWLSGAWPVVGFCGLDVLLIQFAFRMNYRAARAVEEISLTRDCLSVRRISASGVAVETGFNPYWARLEVDRHPEFGVTSVRIASHGERLPVAKFLGPREREGFAAALSSALSSVRSLPAS
jgi:uncharacterized membrane protein